MSGPIVRKYGFPNHDQIFGKKEIEHGVEEPAAPAAQPAAPARSNADAKPASETPSKPKRSKK